MSLRKILISVAVGLAATAIVFAGCGREKVEQQAKSPEETARVAEQPDMSAGTPGETSGEDGQPARLPRLVDLGKGTCIPCKKMAPILEELKKEYEGRAVVEVIDLRDDPGAAKEYGIRLIPTQIFYDAGGEEVLRHEGFMAKDAIRAQFEEMGVERIDN
ncbi:thioredoxin family protein [Candidatus Eisenbacteria bacterium]|uniref:Thioredoxin family protein n=1 Tax=Eiseniibacteriota bacterium TaxID=2212470 RepID=A0ABV6YPR1_UNCEI